MSKLEDTLDIYANGQWNPGDSYDEHLSNPCFNSDLEMKTIEYGPNGMPNSQRAVNQAQIEGLEVVYPKDNQLQIDIDNQHSYSLLQNMLCIVNKFIGPSNYEEKPSKSGNPHKFHVTLTFEDHVKFTGIERLALQAMLGSDRVRELLGYVQEKNGDPHPVLFLEKTAPKQLTSSTMGMLTEGVMGDTI